VMVLGASRWKEEGRLRCGENWEGVGAFILLRGRLGGHESRRGYWLTRSLRDGV
jgi:hypothetical protein